jgi:hypothetical protein
MTTTRPAYTGPAIARALRAEGLTPTSVKRNGGEITIVIGAEDITAGRALEYGGAIRRWGFSIWTGNQQALTILP